jgi:hypothetical protein
MTTIVLCFKALAMNIKTVVSKAWLQSSEVVNTRKSIENRQWPQPGKHGLQQIN